MRISALVKTKNGIEKGVTRKLSDRNMYDVFDEIDNIITGDIRYIRIVIYDDNANPLFALSSTASRYIDWIGLSCVVDSISKNIILGV